MVNDFVSIASPPATMNKAWLRDYRGALGCLLLEEREKALTDGSSVAQARLGSWVPSYVTQTSLKFIECAQSA